MLSVAVLLPPRPSLALPPSQIYNPFIGDFLRQVVSEGLQAIVPDFFPIPQVLFGKGTTHDHLCEEVISVSCCCLVIYFSRVQQFTVPRRGNRFFCEQTQPRG